MAKRKGNSQFHSDMMKLFNPSPYTSFHIFPTLFATKDEEEKKNLNPLRMLNDSVIHL
jgi:hypothetical protein